MCGYGLQRGCKAAGFSLIELMIALLLGTLIIGGLISVMIGIKQTSSLNDSLTEVQSNGRFAMDRLSREIRMAGYQGCLDFNDAQLMPSVTNGPTTNLQNTAVYASVIGATTWAPAAPQDYKPPNTITPIVGSHALIIQRADSEVFNIDTSMLGESDNIKVQAPEYQFAKNGLAMITNCEAGDLFEISDVSETAGRVTLSPSKELSTTYYYNASKPEAVQVMSFAADIYFIADTGRNYETGENVVSLYLQTWPYVDSNPPQEIIEGVENMMTRFGHRTNNALSFLAPDSADFNPQEIVSVDVGMVLISAESVATQDDDSSYMIAGVEITPQDPTKQPTAITHAGNRKLRRSFNATINVRNRRQ